MDASSLITQVKKPESGNAEASEGNLDCLVGLSEAKSKNEQITDISVPENTATEIHSKNFPNDYRKSDCKKTRPKKQKSNKEFSAGSPSSSFGSRLLAQLFCCFGLGHVPDYNLASSADEEVIVNHSKLLPAEEDEAADPQSELVKLDIEEQPEDDLFAFSDLGGLLPAEVPDFSGRICAVIDLDETLVHSSFQCPDEPDFSIEVEVEGVQHQIYVLKRPFVDEFLHRVGQLFECVLFTASMGKYADPVCDALDPNGSIHHRLFREACVYHCDSYVKDLATLGRPVDRCFIMDNSPASYMFNVDNAIHVNTWTGEPDDTELRDLIPYLDRLASSDSVAEFLRNNPSPTGAPVSMAQFAVAMRMHSFSSES
ncbi:hypothetical protein BOX15_Mlig018266g1 [Macrostomum lignano]|uniref:FCP1 homology domain-containing protein n=2 Tax=Macrostomum lignano TaxID=282301 RepID=A0A1I8J662_9PLAT|nr:hypothetical protein BOX15_Mlig018266g1 [Macrostomum lignano]